jgi:hypothetical protein
MAFTSTLGDHAASLGNLILAATSGIVTVRWEGPFGNAADLGNPNSPTRLSQHNTAQVSYAQAVQLQRASDPSWWAQP